MGRAAERPNDPKLSDRRSRRGTCRWVARRRWSAAGSVTAEPVRRSVWFGNCIWACEAVSVTRLDGIELRKTTSNKLLKRVAGILSLPIVRIVNRSEADVLRGRVFAKERLVKKDAEAPTAPALRD